MKGRRYVPWLLSGLLGLILTACSGSATPTEGTSEPLLDAAVRTFITDMDSGYGALTADALTGRLALEPRPYLIDVRNVEEVQTGGYIEGAVLMPVRDLAKNTALLPPFDTPIVAYSGTGWRSTIGMTALELLGWKSVYSLIDGGFAGWVQRGYPVATGVPAQAQALSAAEPDPAILAQVDQVLTSIPEGWGVITPKELSRILVEDPDVVLIDVRSEEEIAARGYIEGAKRLILPIEQLLERRADWPGDKTTRIVTYCGTGHRCTIVMTILWAYGYADVGNLEGGLKAWMESGYPVHP